MRGDAVYRDFALSAAHEAVEERLEDSSADPDVLPELEEIGYAVAIYPGIRLIARSTPAPGL
jgi:hypothetical protein